jgi:hypothetical protein
MIFGSLPSNGCLSIVESVISGMFMEPLPSNGHMHYIILRKLHLRIKEKWRKGQNYCDICTFPNLLKFLRGIVGQSNWCKWLNMSHSSCLPLQWDGSEQAPPSWSQHKEDWAWNADMSTIWDQHLGPLHANSSSLKLQTFLFRRPLTMLLQHATLRRQIRNAKIIIRRLGKEVGGKCTGLH